MKGPVKMLVMDVDGTLTDGKIYISNTGEVCKAFNVKDGLRIKQLPQYGITTVIITGRESRIVAIRSAEMGIKELHQGIDDKFSKLIDIVKENNISLENVAYIGDDENDIQCMEQCGLSACTADAPESIKKIVDYVCLSSGGCGAVREFIDYFFVDKA